MWYSWANLLEDKAYQLRYAISEDGIFFEKKKAVQFTNPDEYDFDCEMACYPFVCEYKGRYYMFYNGNELGIDGFGLAIGSAKF